MHRLAILVGVMHDANCDKIINLAFARNYMLYFWIRMYLYWGNRLNQEGQRRVSHLDLLSTKPKGDLGSDSAKRFQLGQIGQTWTREASADLYYPVASLYSRCY